MKKRKQVLVTLGLLIDNEPVHVDFHVETMRNWINSLKIEPGQETVEFEFNLEGKHYSQNVKVDTELASIKRAVKYVELLPSIIPNYLSKYLTDITQEFSQKNIPRIVGREHEIEKTWFYLSQKTRNNVFLLGNKDVGKTSIANEIARRIACNDCPKEFYNKRVLKLSPELLLKIESNILYKRKVQQVIDFLESNKDVILFIDKAIYMKTDIELLYVLYACLKEYNIPLMVTSSEDNFEDYFYDDQSIAKYINYIYVKEPELNEVEPMVRPYISELEKQYDIAISDKLIKYAIFTSGLSPSVSANPGRVINIFERAFLTAKLKDKSEVDKECILSCYDAQIREYSKMPEKEKRATAYHETGHYIVTVKSEHRKNIKISCVSNLPMSWWLGVTMYYWDAEQYAVSSKDYFLDSIAVCLAGRIAEKKFTNLNSTGASNDLAKANDFAKAMIMDWGFSDNPLNINRQYGDTDLFLIPESKKEIIDREIQELIDEGTKRAEAIINENEELLKIIAEKLLSEEILTGEELQAICEDYEQSKK